MNILNLIYELKVAAQLAPQSVREEIGIAVKSFIDNEPGLIKDPTYAVQWFRNKKWMKA